MPGWPVPIEGSCGCGHIRYLLKRQPIFTHCCNCHQCQRETGSAFALNALIETEEVVLQSNHAKGTGNLLKHVVMPSESGKGQAIARCPRCFVAVWSCYPDNGPHLKFLKTATLNKKARNGATVEALLRPDAFIFTEFKQPWVQFPDQDQVFEEFYDTRKMYTKDAYERLEAVRVRGRQWAEDGGNWNDLGDVEDLRPS